MLITRAPKNIWANLDRLYIITTQNLWPSKIGYSISPGVRLSTLQSANWVEIGLYATFIVPDAKFAEEVILRVLMNTGKKLNGEWYDMNAEEMFNIIRVAIKFKLLE